MHAHTWPHTLVCRHFIIVLMYGSTSDSSEVQLGLLAGQDQQRAIFHRNGAQGGRQADVNMEVVLAQVTPAAFECILRAAANLDPKHSPQNSQGKDIDWSD